MTPVQWSEVVAILESAYPRERLTPQQVKLYALLLRPYDQEAVTQAALAHIKRSPYFPRISDLVSTLDQDGLPDVDEAWGEVLRQIRAVGYYGQPQWTHPAIAETVAALGWQELCMSDNAVADRAHFGQFYGKARTRAQNAQAAAATAQALAAGGLSLTAIGNGGVPQ